ncbi:MAG: hypothetical protein AAGH76_02630 [Pseudomonadota bacterium]
MSADDKRTAALFDMVLNVVQELWIVKDRQMILERVLSNAGIDVAETVDNFQPDAELTAQMDSARRQLLAKCLGSANDLDPPE